jgi:hypothetical protein
MGLCKAKKWRAVASDIREIHLRTAKYIST